MKSLRESLFDKDLVKKDLTIRDTYELLDTCRGINISTSGFNIGQMFDINKLNKYARAYELHLQRASDSLQKLIGVIADLPAPNLKNWRRDGWDDLAKKTLSKYIKSAWKQEWNNKVDIDLVYYANDRLGIVIDIDHGEGEFEFVFEPIN